MKKLLVLTMIAVMSFSIFGCESAEQKAANKAVIEANERQKQKDIEMQKMIERNKARAQ